MRVPFASSLIAGTGSGSAKSVSSSGLKPNSSILTVQYEASSAMPLLSWKLTDLIISWSTIVVISHWAFSSLEMRAIRSSSVGRANERWSNCRSVRVINPAGFLKVWAFSSSKKAIVLPGPSSKK